MSKSDERSALEKGETKTQAPTPFWPKPGDTTGKYSVDALRHELMHMLRSKGSMLKISNCPGDCFKHADAHVVYCYDRYEPLIQEELKHMPTIDFTTLDYQNAGDLEGIELPILTSMASQVTSEEFRHGIKAVTGFSKGTVFLADYIASNLPEGLVWEPAKREFVPGGPVKKKKVEDKPKKKRGRPRKTPVVEQEVEAAPKQKVRRTPVTAAPIVETPTGGVGPDDIAEVLAQIETSATSTQDSLKPLAKKLNKQAKQLELLEQGMLLLLRVNYTQLMNLMGSDETLKATTLEEAVVEMGE